MLGTIIERLKKYEASRWDVFPEFDVYMDQLLACAGSSISFSGQNDTDDMSETSSHHEDLTTHRVNNYVKQGYLPKPENRKYSREHLARLYVLRMTKGDVPLSLISGALERLMLKDSARKVSENYAGFQEELMGRITKRLEGEEKKTVDDGDGLDYLALSLAAEAHVLSLVSETILSMRNQGSNHKDGS